MPDGLVTDKLVEFHRRVAAGGVAMSTVAYLAVSPKAAPTNAASGCGPTPWTAPPLTTAIHDEGRPRRPARPRRAGGQRPLQPGPVPGPVERLQPLGTRLRGASEADIDRITEDFRAAAALATEAGFDCLEIHLGHNYL